MHVSDVATVPLTDKLELVIASDNSATIGNKEHDIIQVDDEVTGYYTCRVAYMDLIRAGASPDVIVLQNFTGNSAWKAYQKGVHQLLAEANRPSLPITGSTETNFTTLQSGLGLTIVGTRNKPSSNRIKWRGTEQFAVIGKPLVGNQAIEQPEHIAPVSLYEQLAQMDEIIDLVPVGSTGIEAEWRQLTGHNYTITSDVNVKQSGGPATCFIIAYEQTYDHKIKELTHTYFHRIHIKK